MKRYGLWCILVLLVFGMMSCQTIPPEVDSEHMPPEDTSLQEVAPFFVLDGSENAAVIVCSEEATAAEFEAALTLQRAIENLTGVQLTVTNDFDAGEDHSARVEILVGETNRPQSAAARAGIDELQFHIGVSEGKLVVLGSGPRITAYAVDVLIGEYLNRDSYDEAAQRLTVPGDTSLERSYYEAVRGNVLQPYTGATNGTNSRPTSDIHPTSVPARDFLIEILHEEEK